MSKTLQEIEKLMIQMAQAEKTQILQWIVRDFGGRFPESKAILMYAAENPALFAPESGLGAGSCQVIGNKRSGFAEMLSDIEG